MIITLFTTFYRTSSEERQNELRECLLNNLHNPWIDKIVIFLELGTSETILQEFEVDKNFKKLCIKRIEGNPTYRDWIRVAREINSNGILLFANADIYFDSSITKLNDYLEKPKSFVCLSRYEDLGSHKVLHSQPHWSQDVWAIKCESVSKISFLKELDFKTGEPRCDNKIAYKFAIHGWDLYNPCFEIQAFHRHHSNIRNYHIKTLVNLGGIAKVHPTRSPSSPSIVDIDFMALKKDNVGKVALNDWLAPTTETETLTE